MFEETINGTLTEILTHFQAKEVKGEIVVVVGGK
jgi:16S rRNA (cytidine1402-2'-O)-methyltransferase